MEQKESLQNLRDEKEALFTQQKEVSQKIGEYINKLKEHKKRRDELTAKVQEGKDQRTKVNEEIREYIEQVKKLQSSSQGPTSPVPMEKGVKLTPLKLKKEIEGIKRTIETAAVSFEKEKELMKKLKERQKLLDKFATSTDGKKAVHDLDKKLKDLKKTSDDIYDVVQDAAKRSQEEHESMLTLSKDIDDLREVEKKLREQIAPLKDKIKDISKASGEYTPKSKPSSRMGSGMQNARPKRNNTVQFDAIKEKMAKGEKLTTADLLMMQNASDGEFSFTGKAVEKQPVVESVDDEQDIIDEELEIPQVDELDEDIAPKASKKKK
jgi:uncharacterized coiled-coil DUF342 family protein